jgi:hypothetical protein
MSSVSVVTAAVVPQPPRLLEQVRLSALARFGRPEPAVRYVEWVRRFILFHGKRHPELGKAEVGRFLTHLAQSEKDPLRSIEQARGAIDFLYQPGDDDDLMWRARDQLVAQARWTS